MFRGTIWIKTALQFTGSKHKPALYICTQARFECGGVGMLARLNIVHHSLFLTCFKLIPWSTYRWIPAGEAAQWKPFQVFSVPCVLTKHQPTLDLFLVGCSLRCFHCILYFPGLPGPPTTLGIATWVASMLSLENLLRTSFWWCYWFATWLMAAFLRRGLSCEKKHLG